MNRKLLIGLAFALVCLIAIFCREQVHSLLSSDDRQPSSFTQVGLVDGPGTVDAVEIQRSLKLLLHAADRLTKLPALRASVRHKIDMFGQQMLGPGNYVQAGQGSTKARLELTFQSGDFQSNVLQINDGRYLYIRNDSADQKLQRIDLAAVRSPEHSEQAASDELQNTYTGINDESQFESSSGSTLAASPSQWMALGGLSWLLEQLAADFDFGPARESTLGKTDVLVLEGTWKPERVAKICGSLQVLDEQGRLLADRLPPQMPTHIRLSLARDKPLQFFPHQVVYMREIAGDTGSSTFHEMATFEFYNVRPAKDLAVATFQIERDDTRLTDITSTVIQTSEDTTVR